MSYQKPGKSENKYENQSTDINTKITQFTNHLKDFFQSSHYKIFLQSIANMLETNEKWAHSKYIKDMRKKQMEISSTTTKTLNERTPQKNGDDTKSNK